MSRQYFCTQLDQTGEDILMRRERFLLTKKASARCLNKQTDHTVLLFV